MNTPNPLIPGGGSSPQAPRFKSNIKIAVVTILAIHAVLFGGLLLQGCKKDSGDVNAVATNALPAFDPLPVPQPDPAVSPGLPVPPPTGLAVPTPVPLDPNALPPGLPAPVPAPVTIPEPPAAPVMREHIVVKNDSFSTMATQYGVSVAAITAANPGVDSRKLQLGQKIVIPPPSAAPAPAAAPADAPKTYTVKSGDTLTKVATMHKTTVKALRAANNLKTDAIKVGQKLTIPTPPAPANP